MTYLRRALLLASFLGAVGLAVLIKTMGRGMTGEELFAAFAAAIFLTLAFFYFLLGPAPEPRTRLGRMFRSWLDAKEQELSARASRARSPDSAASDAGQHKS